MIARVRGVMAAATAPGSRSKAGAASRTRTAVAPDGSTRNLDRDAFTVTVTDHWTSPKTGAVYPAAWTIAVPGDDLTITLKPTVADQELDPRATTGVIYWEGSQVVTATRAGRSLPGLAYVELTGYASSVVPAP